MPIKIVFVPVGQFTGEGGYYINFLSDRRKTFFPFIGLFRLLPGMKRVIGAINCCMMVSTLTNKDAFIYGGALTLELEAYLTDRVVLLFNGRERCLWGSSIGTFTRSSVSD